MSFTGKEAAIFAVGDKVKLKPNQSSEDEVLAHLSYDKVYTVGWVDSDRGVISLEGTQDFWGDFPRQEWTAGRFESAAEIPVPKRGDLIEVVIRARVSSVLPVPNPRHTVVYFEDVAGNHVPPVVLCENDAVQSLTIVEPAKPKLDLHALPAWAVVQAVPTGEVYVKGDAQRCYPWADMNGATLSSYDLAARHTELVELVRKEATA